MAIKIENAEAPDSGRVLQVTQQNFDTSRTPPTQHDHLSELKPGESRTFYAHGGNRFILRELVPLALLLVTVLGASGCDRWPWEGDPAGPSVIVQTSQTVTFGATPTPAPSPTPTPSTLVRPATVRVSPYGIDCPSPIPTPNNGAGVLPVSCVADVTATPKRADGTDLTDAEHGPAIEWELVAVDKSVVEVSTFPGVAFNRKVRGVRPGRFRLCATVQGVSGCWGSEDSPVEVVG